MVQGTTSDGEIDAHASSGVTVAVRFFSSALVVVCALWALQIPAYAGYAFFTEQFLAVVLGLSFAVTFLSFTPSRRESLGFRWYDACLAGAALAILFYLAFDYEAVTRAFAWRSADAIALGAAITLLVLEGLRRTTGYILVGIVSLFIVYAAVGHLIPGVLGAREAELEYLVLYLNFDPSGLFGPALKIGAVIVVQFILMGRLLHKAGGGEFFTDLALMVVGRRRGGSAKIGVVASSLFGSISGSAVSNVVTTGMITIPLMRRAGYPATHAAAIEAVASTGGQLMPPVMGAASFIMAEFLSVDYTEVMLAALVPAALYYFAAFVQVDLLAGRFGAGSVEVVREESKLRVLYEGWHLILPFVVLVYLLFAANARPEVAALWASLTIVIGGSLRSYRGHKLRPGSIVACFWETGRSAIDLIMIVAAAGFVIGVLNLTGLGFALTLYLVNLAGNNLLILLATAAVVCLVLGMGMPTTAVYVLLAALVAPPLVQAGIEPMAAHLFILYFGMMSMITPPIALAAYAAANIAKANPMASGFAAMRIGWVAFIIPFLFTLTPTLILQGDARYVALNIISALIGVFLVSIASVGYLTRPLRPGVRVTIGVAGAAALIPDTLFGTAGLVDLAGIVVGSGVVLYEVVNVRRARRINAAIAR